MKRHISAFFITSVILSSTVLSSQLGVEASKIQQHNQIDVIEGYFENVEENIMKIKDYDGKISIKHFDTNTVFMLNERSVKISEFKKGMQIYAKTDGENIVYMDSFTVDDPGYITPNSKQRSGVVVKIDRNQITIKTAIETEETYFTDDVTLSLKDGKNVELNSIYVGDRVRIEFDNDETDIISKINIEGKSVKIKDLYRGKIAVTNRMSSVVSFQDVEVFRNGKWMKIDTIRLPYNSDLPLYVGGEKINYRNLENYRGKTVYMAIKDLRGRDGAEKMVIKNKNEMTFSDKIVGVNHFTSELELSNKRNISFHEGTMIIKNGRLVDSHSITPNSSALVVADGRGASSTADVIYLYDEEINNSNIGMDMIYAGRLESIGEYTLDLRDFFVLNKNKWESFPWKTKEDIKELYYDSDTFIYDVEKNKTLTSQELLSGEYHIDEDNDKGNKNLRDYYAYIYTDGDRISGIYLRKSIDSLLRHRIVTATLDKNPLKYGEEIEAIDENIENPRLKLGLRDIRDWSEKTESWKLKYENLNVEVKDALVMKNGERIKTSELKKGDKIYMVMDDITTFGRQAKVIIVK